MLVSGGRGYIAGFLIRQPIAEGWTVHTTLRSLARASAVRMLLVVDDKRLHVFAADLNAHAGWAEAMADCSHVAQRASPLAAHGIEWRLPPASESQPVPRPPVLALFSVF